MVSQLSITLALGSHPVRTDLYSKGHYGDSEFQLSSQSAYFS